MSGYSGLDFRQKGPRNSKYDKGIAPCGSCSRHVHARCRPTLAGSFCTCSCKYAAALRSQAAEMEGTEAEKAASLMRPVRRIDYGDALIGSDN